MLKELLSKRIYYLIYTQSDYWFISDRKLHSYNKLTKKINVYDKINDPKQVLQLFKFDDEYIWLNSDYGLYQRSLKTDSINHFTKKDGLPNNVTLGVAKDQFNTYWISTNNGISRYVPTKGFTNYFKSDGLPVNEYTNSALRSSDGHLVFGGYGGIITIDPAKLISPQRPKISVSAVFLGEEKYYSINHLDEFNIDYTSNNVMVNLMIDNLNTPNRNSFAYKLGSSNWIDLENNYRFTLANLPYGGNTIAVKGKTSGGEWSNEAFIKVNVEAPFWMQTWFYILLGVLLLLTSYAIYLYRLRQVMRINSIRTKVSSDLHDDVGSTLTKISLMIDFSKGSEDVSEMKRLMNDISEMSKSSIESMSDIVWAIDVRNDTVGDLIGRMEDFISGLRKRDVLDILFSYNGFPEEKKLSLQMRKNIYLIFKEALTNTFKYSESSKIWITLSNVSQFKMTISHNGTAERKKKNSGHGIRNMNQRALNSNLDLVIDEANGFSVQLSGNKL